MLISTTFTVEFCLVNTTNGYIFWEIILKIEDIVSVQ